MGIINFGCQLGYFLRYKGIPGIFDEPSQFFSKSSSFICFALMLAYPNQPFGGYRIVTVVGRRIMDTRLMDKEFLIVP